MGQSLNMTLNGAICVEVVALYCCTCRHGNIGVSLGQVYVYDVKMYDDVNFQAHEKADIDIPRVACIIVVSQINTVIFHYLQTSTSASVPRARTAGLA